MTRLLCSGTGGTPKTWHAFIRGCWCPVCLRHWWRPARNGMVPRHYTGGT